MNTEEIKKRILEIEKTYKVYLEKLLSLKKEQDELFARLKKLSRENTKEKLEALSSLIAPKKQEGSETIDHTPFRPTVSVQERVIDQRGVVHYGGDTIADVELKAQWAREDAEKIWSDIMESSPVHTDLQQAFDITNAEIDKTMKDTVKKIQKISGINPEQPINDGSVPI